MSAPPIAEPPSAKKSILVTGLSGNVGRRLAAHLQDFSLVAVDLFPPKFDHPAITFSEMDLSAADSSARLVELIARHNVGQVVHLAFVLDPWRTGAMTLRRQWEINVQGTQRLLEAIEEANRERTQVEHMLYLSSVTSYGPNLPGPVDESYPQRPHTYTYALHKKETDELCRYSHPLLNGCAVTIVRGHIFLGAGVENFISLALNGTPNPHRPLGRWLSRHGFRLPLLLPLGKKHRGLYQFMHIDDSARILAWLCRNYRAGELNVLNLQGRGRAITGDELARLAGLKMLRLPFYTLVSVLYRLSWWLGISSVPPDALPYFAGSYVMDDAKLKGLLGKDFEKLIRYTSEASILETVAGRKAK